MVTKWAGRKLCITDGSKYGAVFCAAVFFKKVKPPSSQRGLGLEFVFDV